MNRPQPDEYHEFYRKYIETVGDNVIAELDLQILEVPRFLRSIPASKHNYAYEEGKWTVKELLGHVIDTERIMAYRLLRFARNDSTELPGFEENHYVQNSHSSSRDFGQMVSEFEAVRMANMCLFKSLTEEELLRTGKANGSELSVRALLFIVAGHLNHHVAILIERYL